jgi:outer membrane protein
MKKTDFIIYFFLVPFLAFPQGKLSLEKAIEAALKNNYSIIIAKNESEIAKNNVTRGNAGFLPEVNLNTGFSFASNDTKQEFVTGNTVDKRGAQSDNLFGGVSLGWTLFDGNKMFATYAKLKELNALGELNARLQVENTVAEVIKAYYDVVRQKQLMRATDSTLAIYAERLKIAEMKFNIGKAAKTELLQAQVDQNAQRSLKLKQKADISTLKIKLNFLMLQKTDADFDVEDEITYSESLKQENQAKISPEKNTSLQFYKRSVGVNELALKETRSQYFPKIGLAANYNFSQTQNQAGFLLFNRNLGWSSGLTASWNLFNGFNKTREMKNAKLTILNSKLFYDSKKTEVESNLQLNYSNFLARLEILDLEEKNLKIAKENIEISLERFRLGEATTLEVKEAQKSYEESLYRLVQARYDAKIAETELIRLKGELVK